MAQCKAYGCLNNKRKNKDKHYFCVPKPVNSERKLIAEKWLHNIGTGHSLTTFPFGRNSVVCEDHFLESCYEEDLQAKLLGYPPKKKLKFDAVPTIFKYRPQKPQSGPEKRLDTRNKRELVTNPLRQSSSASSTEIADSTDSEGINSLEASQEECHNAPDKVTMGTCPVYQENAPLVEELLPSSMPEAKNPTKSSVADQTQNLNPNEPNTSRHNLHSEQEAPKQPHIKEEEDCKPIHIKKEVTEESQTIKKEEPQLPRVCQEATPKPSHILRAAAPQPPRLHPGAVPQRSRTFLILPLTPHVPQNASAERPCVGRNAVQQPPHSHWVAAPEPPHIQAQELETAECSTTVVLEEECVTENQSVPASAECGAAPEPQVQFLMETSMDANTRKTASQQESFSVSPLYMSEEQIQERIEGFLPMQMTIISRKNSELVEQVEKILSAWIEDQRQKRAPLDLTIIKEKAQNIYKLLKTGENAPSQESQLDNSVKSLLATPFLSRTFEQRLAVKELGPHRPEVVFNQQSVVGGRKPERVFFRSWFTTKTWLTACPEIPALFCFPCLLFQRTRSDPSWSKTGMTDLDNFFRNADKHEESYVHLVNALRLATLGKVSIARQLDERYSRAVTKHNRQVDKNLQLLSEMIDHVKTCDVFALALRCRRSSKNPGDLTAAADLGAVMDALLHKYLKNGAVEFQGSSKTFQGDLLDCMSLVLRECVVAEIRSADYVAIQAAETTDASNRRHLALVFRYIGQSHDVHERFFDLLPLQDATADSVGAALLTCLKWVLPIDLKVKLISQSYDGTTEVANVHKKIQEMYPNAHYVHSYAQQLHAVVRQVASRLQPVRTFFSELARFSAFFSGSQTRLAVLDAVASELPGTSEVTWNFQGQAVKLVFEKRKVLLSGFQIIKDSGAFDPNTANEARELLCLLEDAVFNYVLKLFNVITLHVELFSRQLQERPVNTVCIQQFVRNIQSIRDTLPKVRDDHSYCAAPPAKICRKLSPDDLNGLAIKVCGVILEHMDERFAFTAPLVGDSLLQAECYQGYWARFPAAALASTVEAYPALKESKLKSELELIYGHPEFACCKSAVALYKLLMRNDLGYALSETAALLRIVITTPGSAGEADRSFPTLTDVRTFAGNVAARDGLAALAALALERNLLRSVPDFNQRVIQKFTSLQHRRQNFRHFH